MSLNRDRHLARASPAHLYVGTVWTTLPRQARVYALLHYSHDSVTSLYELVPQGIRYPHYALVDLEVPPGPVKAQVDY